MLNVPSEIKELFKQNNITGETRRRWKLSFFDSDIVLLFPEEVLFPSEDLYPIDQEPIYVIENSQMSTESIILTESLSEMEDLVFGQCNASQFEVTVADVLQDLTGKEFMVSVEVGGYEMAMGIYTVDSFVRQADRRLKKITAYDRMRKFETDVASWYHSLNFPLTLKQFRNSLCTHVGIIELETELPLDDMIVNKTIEPEQLYGVDVIEAICEINGCFGHMDKTGRFKYQFLTRASLFPSEELFPDEELFPAEMSDEDSETLTYYKQSDTTYEDYVVNPIDRIQIRQEEGDIGILYGPGSNCYVIQGNFLVYGKSSDELMQIAATAYDEIAGRQYRPCKIVSSAMPWVEIGDGLICYTTDDVIETYCLKRIMKGIQQMMDTYEAFGNIEQEESFGIHTQIIQLEGKAAVLKKSVDEVSVRVTDLKEYTEAQFKITAEEIAAEVRRAQDAEARLSIRADEISASVSDLRNDTEAQFKITAEEIAAEVRRAQDAEASLNLRADQITLLVTDYQNDTNSRFEQTADQIALKVSKGDVSSQLSVESDKITLSGNRLIVNSTNFQLDGSGNATFSGRVEGASIVGGTINIGEGTFEVDRDGAVVINSGEISIGPARMTDSYAWMGNFGMSSGEYGVFYSRDFGVEIYDAGNSLENGPAIKIEKNGLKTRIGYGGIVTEDIVLNDLRKEYGASWESVSYNIIELWNRVAELEDTINNME